MGLRRLETIADRLILAGRRVDEGAAVISRLSLGDSAVRVGTLGTIAAVARGMATPSVVIVGDVVLQAERLRELAETCDRGGDALATRREAVLHARRPVVDQKPREDARPLELG